MIQSNKLLQFNKENLNIKDSIGQTWYRNLICGESYCQHQIIFVGTFGEESTLKLQMEKVVGFKGMDMTNTASI
jgi:hypothetical protein